MFEILKSTDNEKNLKRMVSAVASLLQDEDDLMAALSNTSGFIMAYTDGLNFAGFYVLKGEKLIIGPFQGLPACSPIVLGKGVCSMSVTQKRTVRVDDVKAFPGHIACDSRSRSELVVPIFHKGEVYGLIDLDSLEVGRFTQAEEKCFEEIAALLSAFLERVL